MKLLALILAADEIEAEQIRQMIVAPDLAGVRAVLMELQPTARPWWASLAALDRVIVANDSPAQLYAAPDWTKATLRQAAAGATLTLWAPARADGWLDVYKGTLWIRAEACRPG